MTLKWLPLAKMRDPAPIAGIVVFLCGFGIIASVFGSAGAVFGTDRLQAAPPTDEALSRAARSAARVRPCTAWLLQASWCDTIIDGSAQRDREPRNHPIFGQEQGSRGEGTASAMTSRRGSMTDMRGQLMVAANLARHRMEPWVVMPWDAPEPPLRHGDQ
jgi:hypothetical protein